MLWMALTAQCLRKSDKPNTRISSSGINEEFYKDENYQHIIKIEYLT